MKKLLCILLIFMFSVCGCSNSKSNSNKTSSPAESENHQQKTPTATISMRNMSFNIRYSEFEENRINLVFEMIEKYNPDTIGFQEATVEWMKILKERLGNKYDYIGVGREPYNTDEACPVFYLKNKFELIEGDTKWLSKTPDIAGSKLDSSDLPRIVTYALLKDKTSNKQFIAANTHLHHKSEAARIEQAAILVKLIEDFNTKQLPIVISGDFNSSENSITHKVLTNAGYSNAANLAKKAEKGVTYHNYGKSGTIIDHFFIPDYCVDIDYYKVCDETFTVNGIIAYPSDHNPIIIDAKYFYWD